MRADTTAATPVAGRSWSGGIAVGAALLGVLGLLWLFGGAERDLHRSAVGFAGLVAWLDANEIDARAFRGGSYLVQGAVGLRILPLHDTDLARGRRLPESSEEMIAQSSESDLSAYVVRAKIELLPTLVVLPKWRTGMRALGAAHRELLIPADELARLVGQIPGLDGRIRRDPAGYVEAPLQGALAGAGAPIGLHHPQTLRGSGCEPLIGTAREMLLARCALPADRDRARGEISHFWLLADPDLMNTHGLTRAGNAEAALRIVQQLAAGRPVVLDLSDEVLAVQPSGPDDAREGWRRWSRLFAWPFVMVWIGFLAVAALVLWRALTRYGPVARLHEDAPRASKEVSIDAKARLLRLARHDRALLAAHIRHRLQQVAAELAGPHLPPGADPLAVLTRLVRRRAPELADELAEAARLPNYRRDWSGVLLRRLDRFENALRQVRNEFGRAAGTRR
jgi:hypothetical protein